MRQPDQHKLRHHILRTLPQPLIPVGVNIQHDLHEHPPHTHAGVEELHLLDGELWIDERKLYPGDYNYGPPGASDERVWSETGCTCVLITSTDDRLR